MSLPPSAKLGPIQVGNANQKSCIDIPGVYSLVKDGNLVLDVVPFSLQGFLGDALDGNEPICSLLLC